MTDFCRRCRTLLALIAVLVAAVTCHSHAYFDLDQAGALKVARGTTPDRLVVLTDVDLTAHEGLSSQGIDTGELTFAELRAATLAVTDPGTGQGLDFLEHVDVVLEAPGVQALTIASSDDFAAGTNLLPLTVQKASLLAAIKHNRFTVALLPTWRQGAPQDLTLTLNLVLSVRVGEPAASCQN